LIFIDDLQGQYAGATGQLNQSISRVGQLAADLPESAEAAQLREAVAALSAQGAALAARAGDPATGLIGEPAGLLGKNVQTVRALAGGFIVTSLLWASSLAAIIDRRLFRAAAFLAVAAT
jgi:hypothetical protein